MSAFFDLGGKTALVTGASRGLGLEMAKALSRAGANVLVNGRDLASLQDVCKELENAQPFAFDISNRKQVAEKFQQLPSLDILVNNVGGRDRRAVDEFGLEDVDQLLASNLVAPFDLCRRAASLMKEGGRIINVTSIAGTIARSGDAVYTASKAGLTGLTRALAAEYGAKGITVNAIAPGFFATEANQSMTGDETISRFLSERTSVGRWGKPEEIASACVFLAASESSYITGQVITVDGGMTAHF